MNTFKHNTTGILRLILLSVVLVTLGLVVSIFFSSRDFLNKPEKIKTDVPAKSTISIGKIRHTASRDGKTEWTLEAGKAEYIHSDKKAVLKDLSVVFFLKNDEKAHLTANQGTFITDAYNIQVSGNVVMKNQGYRLKTETLNYDHEKRRIYTETPVTIEGSAFSLTADTLNLDLINNKTILNGNVRGVLSENFNIL